MAHQIIAIYIASWIRPSSVPGAQLSEYIIFSGLPDGCCIGKISYHELRLENLDTLDGTLVATSYSYQLYHLAHRHMHEPGQPSAISEFWCIPGCRELCHHQWLQWHRFSAICCADLIAAVRLNARFNPNSSTCHGLVKTMCMHGKFCRHSQCILSRQFQFIWLDCFWMNSKDSTQINVHQCHDKNRIMPGMYMVHCEKPGQSSECLWPPTEVLLHTLRRCSCWLAASSSTPSSPAKKEEEDVQDVPSGKILGLG